jgi:hypothetical protein
MWFWGSYVGTHLNLMLFININDYFKYIFGGMSWKLETS